MNESHRYLHPVLIYNPIAGAIRRNPERILQRTIAALASRDALAHRDGTTWPRAMRRIWAGKASRAEQDLVMVLGGDGTDQ